MTPETARLLQHWRHHDFKDIRPFLLPDRSRRDDPKGLEFRSAAIMACDDEIMALRDTVSDDA